jgi:hypothetical protein
MNRLDEIDEILKHSNIDSDSYRMWKENAVTKRFMLEIEVDLLETRIQYPHQVTIEEIAISAIKNGEHCETLESVLTWKPEELLID